MDYAELKTIVKEGDIVQIAAPYITGVGKVSKILPNTLVLDPYKHNEHAENSIPEITLLMLEDVRLLFLLKPTE